MVKIWVLNFYKDYILLTLANGYDIHGYKTGYVVIFSYLSKPPSLAVMIYLSLLHQVELLSIVISLMYNQ